MVLKKKIDKRLWHANPSPFTADTIKDFHSVFFNTSLIVQSCALQTIFLQKFVTIIFSQNLQNFVIQEFFWPILILNLCFCDS